MNITSNIRRVTNLFIILFLGLTGGLVYWQAVVAQPVTANIRNNRHCMPDEAPVRGRILDRNGVVLAESRSTELGRTRMCGYQRFYIDPSLAGLVGTYISPLYASSGIERQYNSFLDGEEGVTRVGNTVNQVLHRPPVGDDIYLTIDSRIQKIVNEAFDTKILIDNVHTFASNRGSVVVMDPKTGEVLAMVSRPGYDPNKYISNIAGNDAFQYINQLQHDSTNAPLLERPLQGLYVPGSIYKVVTLMAGIDSGAVHLDDKFYNNDPGTTDWEGKPQAIKVRIDNETFGPEGNNIGENLNFPVNLNYGFTHSDNIIFAQVGAKTGINTWVDYNKRFYVEDKIPFDLPVAVSRVKPVDGSALTLHQVAENAFGQGINQVTPLQMSMFDNAIANDGTLMRPQLVSKIVDHTGAVIQASGAQQLGNPVSAQTATQVRDAMYGVAQCGSGRFAYENTTPPLLNESPWQIIAKTGTGQVGGDKQANGWLLSQAPYQDPKLTIVAMRENAGEGGSTAGPMVKVMYDRIFSEVMKLQHPSPPPVGDYTTGFCAQKGLIQGG